MKLKKEVDTQNKDFYFFSSTKTLILYFFKNDRFGQKELNVKLIFYVFCGPMYQISELQKGFNSE